MFNNCYFWISIYLVSAVCFSQAFKKANRNMKNATCLTLLLEGFTALFSLCFVSLFPIKFSTNLNTYFIFILVGGIYAICDRLNIEARYGLEPSTFSMLKQLSTVFIIIFGIVFLKQDLIWHKLGGALIIVICNLFLAFNNGKFTFNKYFIMSVISNFLFAVAMLININISNQFNIGLYTFLTVGIPFILILIISRTKLNDLKKEFKLYDKKLFIFSSLTWALMLISSVRAYEVGSVIIVASFLALTSILNSVVELIINKDRKTFFKKIILSILILVGIILVRL